MELVTKVSITIEPSLLEKMRCVAEMENRSLSKQMCVAVRQFLERYEEMHGEITQGFRFR